MRHIISILLIGAAIGVALFGMLGLPGRMSRKPPVELYSDRAFPGMDQQPKLRPMEPNNCRPPALSRAVSRLKP